MPTMTTRRLSQPVSVVRPLQGRSRAQEGEATPLGHSPTSGQGLPAGTCSSSKVQ